MEARRLKKEQDAKIALQLRRFKFRLLVKVFVSARKKMQFNVVASKALLFVACSHRHVCF